MNKYTVTIENLLHGNNSCLKQEKILITEVCLFCVEDETLESIEYLLFEVYIGLEGNDYNYNYYEDEYAVLDAADNFE